MKPKNPWGPRNAANLVNLGPVPGIHRQFHGLQPLFLDHKLMCQCAMAGVMQTYPVKPGHAGKIDFKMIFEAAFGSFEEDDGWLKTSYGSMPKIWAKQEGKKGVVVDTETDKGVAKAIAAGGADAQSAMALAQDTQRTWNDFLEGVTGYNAKARSKKIQEAAKKEAKAKAA